MADYDTIVATGQTIFTSNTGGSFENILVDVSTGNDFLLVVDEPGSVVRNVGFSGLYRGSQFAISVNAPSGTCTLDNIYLGDGCSQSGSSHAHGPGGVFYHPNAGCNLDISSVTIRGFSNNGFYCSNSAYAGRIQWEDCYTVNCGVTHYRGANPNDSVTNCVGYNTSGERHGTSSGSERYGRIIWCWEPGPMDLYDTHVSQGPATLDAIWSEHSASGVGEVNFHSGGFEGDITGSTTTIDSSVGSPDLTPPSSAPLTAVAAASGESGDTEPEPEPEPEPPELTPSDTMYVQHNADLGEQLVEMISTSRGDAHNIYVNHDDGEGERFVWTSEEPDAATEYIYRYAAEDLRLDVGESVAVWPEAVQEHDAEQIQEPYQPTFIEDGIGGNPTVEFEAEDYLESGFYPNEIVEQPFTIVMVAEYEPQNDHAYAFYGANYNGNRTFLNMDRNGEFTWWAGTTGGVRLPNTGDPHVFVLVANGSESVLQVDHTAEVGNAGTLGHNGMTIGAQAGGSRGFPGRIGDLRVYDWAFHETEREFIVNELRSEWNLGDDTLYGE